MSSALALALVASALPAHAQAPDATVLILRAAANIDGTGAVRTNTDVVGRERRIAELRPAKGRADIDLGTRVLTPGLIDTQVHMGWYINAKQRLHRGDDGDSEQTATLNVIGNAQRMLQAGFTTVQRVGGFEDKAVRNAINRGVIAGPRVLTSLGALNENAGSPDSTAKAAVRAGGTQVDHGVLVDEEALQMMAKYEADLVSFDGDPRTDASAFQRVAFVMKHGVVYRSPPASAGRSRKYP